MPRLIIAGEPGEVHENDTAKVVYQLIVQWRNSCGLCIQYDHQIGPLWPCPFHRNCNCRNVPILPGMSAQPFVDFRAKILTVPPSQQAVIVGKSNLAMVESGLVKWEDVVTPSRIRSLREVASRKRLTVDQMVGSGVTRGRAEEAWNAVHTGTHTASEAARAAQVKALLAKGYTRQQVTDAAGRAIGSRIGIVEGPSGPQTLAYTPKPTPRPVPKAIPTPGKKAALPAPKPKKPVPARPEPKDSRARALSRAGKLVKAAGYKFDADGEMFLLINGYTEAETRTIAAFYNPRDRTIYINAAHPQWDDATASAESNHRYRYLSSGDKDHTAVHEIGHALHHQEIGDDEFDRAADGKFDPATKTLISDTVSLYGASSKAEFVAEVYAALRAGIEYPPEIMKLYESLGGPKP